MLQITFPGSAKIYIDGKKEHEITQTVLIKALRCLWENQGSIVSVDTLGKAINDDGGYWEGYNHSVEKAISRLRGFGLRPFIKTKRGRGWMIPIQANQSFHEVLVDNDTLKLLNLIRGMNPDEVKSLIETLEDSMIFV